MKSSDWLILFLVIVAGGTVANLIALKIAGDQVSAQLDASGPANLLKLLSGKYEVMEKQTPGLPRPQERPLCAPGQMHRVQKRAGQGPAQEPALRLTDRQAVILKRTAQGFTLKQIAGELGISSKTAWWHYDVARRKIGARGVPDVCLYIYRLGWVACLALMLAGCARPGVAPPRSVTPPLPTVTSRRDARSAPSPQTFTLPGPDPLLRTLAWCYPPAELPAILFFRIYQTTNLTPPVVWTHFTNVPAPALSVSFRGVLPQQFFIFTAVDHSGSESGYNIRAACP